MAASLSDQNLLSQDTGFLARVRQSMINTANTIAAQSLSVGAFQRERQTYAVAILNNPDAYKQLFANVLGGDANCSNDATAAGVSGSFTASIAAAVMTVTGTPTGTAIGVGQTISGAGIPAGVTIISLGTGTGAAGTYNISTSLTIASEAVTTGPTTLTTTNAAAQAALVTDAHINTAVNNDFNSFFRTPAS